MEMHPAYLILDPFLIWSYRITGIGLLDFFIGTFCLALIALIVGEITISLLFLINRRHIDAVNNEVEQYRNLSFDALQAKNKAAFKAANKLANEAFGNSFFMQIALSAGFLWPIFFALAWMDYRFADVEFNLLFSEYSMGYVGTFIVVYIAAYLIFRRVKHHLPFFKRVKASLDTYGELPDRIEERL